MNKKRRFILLGVIAVIILALGTVIYFHTVLSVHLGLIESTHNYQVVLIAKEPYVLETVKKERKDGVYASFFVRDKNRGKEIFTCDQDFRTWDLKSIDWDQEGYDIIVQSGDVGTLRYHFSGDTWILQE